MLSPKELSVWEDSAYERRAGWRRFTAVFVVAAVISSMGDLLWLQPQTASMGASAGLCGLAAAYFLDYRDLTLSHRAKGLLLILFIIGLYSYIGPQDKHGLVENINPVSPFSGVFAGAVYVSLVQPKTAPAISPQTEPML